VIADWEASIAGADMADWITVAAYLFAAVLSVRAARHARLRREQRESLFWRFVAVLLVLLGINELLDLQALLTLVGRAHAKATGWYEGRRQVQEVFVVSLTVAAVVLGAVMLWLIRRTHPAVRLAFAGLVFIGLFVLLRAASLHHLERIMGLGLAAFNLGSVQEMAGILIVAAAAWFYARKSRKHAS
jgi:hypothetical protein